MNEDGTIGQVTIILSSGAEVTIDDSCFEDDGNECLLVKSHPEDTEIYGYFDVDVNITMEDSIVTDIENPNAEARKRLALRSVK